MVGCVGRVAIAAIVAWQRAGWWLVAAAPIVLAWGSPTTTEPVAVLLTLRQGCAGTGGPRVRALSAGTTAATIPTAPAPAACSLR